MPKPPGGSAQREPAYNGKTLSDLLMGDRPVGGGGPGGRAPKTGADAELQAVAQIYQALCKQITREIIAGKNWRMLPEQDLRDLRHTLETARDALPVKI